MYLSQDQDDAEAIRRCLSGDAGAFEVLVGRYERVLYTVALRMLGNAEDAADATQNAFLKAYEWLGSFDPAFRFFSWIYRILTNECLNALRDRRPQEPVTPEMAVAPGPLDALEADERRRVLQAALMTLPIDAREVIVLRHFGELSYDEMAATLGIPAKTVKSRLYTARQQLGQRLLGWSTRR